MSSPAVPRAAAARLALALALVLGSPTLARPQSVPAQPTGAAAPAGADSTTVSAEAVAAGRRVFHGKGNCAMCHGAHLQGGLGPTLRAHAWKDATGGELPAIVRVITEGVPGTVMVAHPGGIDDAQAREVAEYVWAVSHGKAAP